MVGFIKRFVTDEKSQDSFLTLFSKEQLEKIKTIAGDTEKERVIMECFV